MIVQLGREMRRWAMNDLESQQATARELISLAQQRGIDLSPIGYDWAFLNEGRFLSLWRKEGKIHYNLQGKVDVLPEKMKDSAALFRGLWVERGAFESIDQAFAFLKAWLLDCKEVDDLPSRSVRSYGIG
jgi:hypothetical protein